MILLLINSVNAYCDHSRTTKFNLLQWNCRSLRARYNELCFLLEEETIDVACLSETFLDPDGNVSFSNFSLIHKARDGFGGGSGVLIRKGVDFTNLPDPPLVRTGGRFGVDVVVVKVNVTTGGTIHIVSLYNPPRRVPHSAAFWRSFLERCLSFGRVIVAGDFNAHSPLWSADCKSSDREGRLIEAALLDVGLVSVNDGSAT